MHKLELEVVLVVGVEAYHQGSEVEGGELGKLEEEEVALDQWKIQMIDQSQGKLNP
jgi:hypothetical protein